MTEKLFYKDPYKSEFDAVVREIKPHGKKGVVEVYLDRSCFYPEGGGQPADIGMIETTEVIDARKSGDDVVHVCREEPRLISGAAVHCTVDWVHRHEYMQQHTGQHLISAALYQAAALNTASVHLGNEYSTVELEAEEIDEELLLSIEREVNQIICRNIPVQVSYLGEGDPGLADLRRPPKVDGEIRVVAVEGIDKAACGGVHVEKTGEVGLVKLIGTESIRGNIRTIWKIGDRAHADYREKTLVCSELSKLFSAPTTGIVDEARELAARLVSVQKGAQDLGKKYAAAFAERHTEKVSESAPSSVTCRFGDEADTFLRDYATAFLEISKTPFCAVNVTDGKLRWVIGAPAMDAADGRELLDKLLPMIDGKGGGKPPLWQGVGLDPAGVDSFFEQFIAAFAQVPE